MQASVKAVETRDVPTAGAAPAASQQRPEAAPRLRLSQRSIELVGLALGIGFLVAVALDHQLSNDEFWSLAAGQWMLSHHGIIGLDPFSYTEAHHRWVTDEWGSEVALAALYRAIGAAAYAVYGMVLGGLCLVASAAYVRTLGARGGRVVIIVLALSLGIASTVVGDRGLDFSLVWFPLELLVLAKARTNPRWLWALPPLCLVWVNTHGSILLGLLVIGVELVWSLAPSRWVAQVHGTHQSRHTRPLALALFGSVVASCLTPYGPGLLVYDAPCLGQRPDQQVHCRMELPGLSLAGRAHRLHRPPRRPDGVRVDQAPSPARVVAGGLLVRRGAADAAPRRVPDAGDGRPGRVAPVPTRLGYDGQALVGRWIVGRGHRHPRDSIRTRWDPSSPTLPVRAFDYLGSHPGRIFTQYTWGDYSIARHRATFVDGRTDLFEGQVLSEFFEVSDLTANPDPILAEYHVDYVVWSPATSLSEYLLRDPRWHVVDRTKVALVFARR